MKRIVSVAFCAALSLTACPRPVPFPEVASLTHADVRARLQAAANRRVAMEGVAKAALPGVGGAIVNATVDVAAAAPARLSVAVRSFFEAPQQVLVADGDTVTLYDASSGAPRFYRGPASERTLARVLGIPLSPDDAVALVLGRAPVDAVRAGHPPPRVRLESVDEQAGTYTARIERAGRGVVVVTARVVDDAIVAFEAWRGDGRPLVRARCGDFVDVAGVAFATRVDVRAVEKNVDVVLTVADARWNPPTLPESAFVLDVPVGAAIDPL